MSNLLMSYELLDYNSDMIKESKEKFGKVRLKGIMQKADALNQNGRIYPRDILEREVRNYQKFIVENRALGECVPSGTEIFTKDGWKKIDDISEDEVIATLNLENYNLEYQKIERKIIMPFKGNLYRFKNFTTYDMCFTPNHNVLMWDRNNKPFKIKAQDLFNIVKSDDKSVRSKISHSSFKRGGVNWQGENPETIMIGDKEVDSKLWAAFLGIYISEGHVTGVYNKKYRGYYTIITQNKGETADKIYNLLEKLPWNFKKCEYKDSNKLDFKIKDKELHAHLLPLGGSRKKQIPEYIKSWSKEHQEILLEWLLLGDGRHREGLDEYCTSSTKLADDVFEINLKCGNSSTIRNYAPIDKKSPDYNETGRMILKENQINMNIVYKYNSEGMSSDLRFMKVEEIPYEGNVYCVTVPNANWLMRYNNRTVWTGNCDHPESSVVNIKNVSHFVKECYMDDRGVVYGTIELLDTPSGKIIQSLVEAGVKLGISSRGIGSTKKQGDHVIVQEDFQLICFDMVTEPSTTQAFMLPEGRRLGVIPQNLELTRSDKIDRVMNDIITVKRRK